MTEDKEIPAVDTPAATVPVLPAAPTKKPGTTSTGVRKASAKPPRSRSREFALQALYQYLVGHNEPTAIDHFTRDLSGFHKADAVHYDALLHGCIADVDLQNGLIEPLLDRKLTELSPIEHAVMWIGVYEFRNREDISKLPWLGDVPVLGNLFKKRGKSHSKAELLVFVTPRVLQVAKR